MRWTCALCRKQFVKPNQPHGCIPQPVDEVLGDEKKHMLLLQKLVAALQKKGTVKLTTCGKGVTLLSRTGFGVVYPKKDGLELGFVLERIHEELPVYKVEPFTPLRYVHWTRLYDVRDVDSALIRLMEEAYKVAM